MRVCGLLPLRTRVPSPLVRYACAQGAQTSAYMMFAAGIAFVGADESDTRGLAFTLCARTLPTLIMAFVGGVLADRRDRRTTASLTLATVTASYFVTAPLVAFGGGLGWPVQLLSLASGFVSAFGTPSLYALLPSLVEDDNLVRANALVRFFRNAAAVAGPLLGALIAANLGTTATFVAAGISGMIATALMASLKIADEKGGPSPENNPVSRDDAHDSGLHSTLRGVCGVLHQYRWLAVGIPFWAVFLAVQSGAADVTLPFVVIRATGKYAWSLMASALSIGYVLGSLVSLRLRSPRRALTGSMAWAVLSAVQLIAPAVTNEPLIWIVVSVVAGIGLEISGVLWGSLLQSQVDNRHLGRVSSLDYAVSFGLIPFAYAAYGMLGIVFDGQAVLLWSAVVMIALGLVAMPFAATCEHRTARTSAD